MAFLKCAIAFREESSLNLLGRREIQAVQVIVLRFRVYGAADRQVESAPPASASP